MLRDLQTNVLDEKSHMDVVLSYISVKHRVDEFRLEFTRFTFVHGTQHFHCSQQVHTFLSVKLNLPLSVFQWQKFLFVIYHHTYSSVDLFQRSFYTIFFVKFALFLNLSLMHVRAASFNIGMNQINKLTSFLSSLLPRVFWMFKRYGNTSAEKM